MIWNEIKTDSQKALKEYGQRSLRVSYLINGGLIVIGLIANFFLPHGWVVWPAVLAIGIMVMINEAAARNATGLPPLVVYGWFTVALLIWVICAFVFSKVAPLLFFAGLPVAIVYGSVMFAKNRKRMQLSAERRAKGLCIHCGQGADYELGLCPGCGKELTADDRIMTRLRINNRSEQDNTRTREVLASAPPTVAAKRKEQALIAARQKAKIKTKPPTAQ